MVDKAAVLTDVCAALSDNQPEEAGAILQERYPFVPLMKVGRRYSVRQMHSVFVRDGFTDRYSDMRLICPATLRLISKRLPYQFPFQTHWRTDTCHFAFYELAPTIDHILPVSRGGTNDESNLATTSMLRNSAKANFTLDELGWSLHHPRGMNGWNGLLSWFIDQANADDTVLNDPYLRQWFDAAEWNDSRVAAGMVDEATDLLATLEGPGALEVTNEAARRNKAWRSEL
jgi:hypothetical protein